MATCRINWLCFAASLIFTISVRGVGGACPGGWEEASGSCYLIQPTAVDHAAAEALCGLYQAKLVSFTSHTEYVMLLKLMDAAGTSHSHYWIGLHRAPDGSYSWTDGSPYSAAVTHWNGGVEGNGYIGVATSCATVDTYNGMVSYQPCVSKNSPFCERPSALTFIDTCNIADGWQDLGGSCYKLYDVPSSWSDARQECLRQNGDLYIPGPSPYVIDRVMSCRISVTHVWLGISDKAQAGILMTVNNSSPNIPWTTTDNVILDQGNTCAEVVTAPNGDLNYYTDLCTHEKQFICQKPHGTCAEGWDQHGSRCYLWQTMPSAATTWYLAKKACADQGAELLVLHDMDEHMFVSQKLVQDKVQYIWLGFSDEVEPDVLLWVDGTPANGSGVFDVWTKSFPYPLPDKVDCGILEVGMTNGTWSHGYCYNSKAYVCDIPLGKPLLPTSDVSNYSCDAGWQLSGNQCYFFGNERDTWNGSSATCRNQGAQLVIINDPFVQSFLGMTIPDTSIAWIGLKLDRNDMNYYWVDANKEKFTNYLPGEPNNQDEGLDCIAMVSGSLHYPGGWFDQNCSRPLDYICQKPAVWTGGPTQLVPVTYPWTYRCGLGWRLNSFDEFCYRIMVDSPKTWVAAKYDCRRRGGDLLSISGPNEQLHIETTLKTAYPQYQDPFWIGASDSTQEGGWEWSDGSPFRYLNWHAGEPNNVGAGEDCTQLVVHWNFAWNDNNCDLPLNYICKKKAAPVTASPTPPIPTLVPPSECVEQATISGVYSLQSQFSFSSSSDYDANHTASHARLLDSNLFSWRPSQDQKGEYVQVNFYQTMLLSSVNVAGELNSFSFVTKYKIQFQYNTHTPWYWIEESPNIAKVFDGPSDDAESAVGFFPSSIQAQRVRLYPQEWGTHAAVRWELNGCVAEACQSDYAISGPLVVMDGGIMASSMSDPEHTPHDARLQPISPDTPLSCWRPGDPFDASNPPWIQVDLGTIKLLHGVTIMGNPDADEYVTTFQLQFQLNDGKGTYASYQEPYGTPMNFTGNVDNNSSVTYLLKSTVPAQHVRLVPLDYHNHVALRFDLLVCSLALCEDIPLLSGKHNVSDFAFTASSYLDPQHGPHRARLRGQSSGAYGDAWVAKFNDAQQYIQVDIGEAVQVWAVATQGSAELQQWVRSYTLAFSQDGKTFSTYSSNGRDPRQFDGNFDASTVRKHYITIPTVARYVQLWPTDYEDGIALRLEVYGCPGPEAGQSLGCFLDDPSDRDLPYEVLIDPMAEVGPVSCRYHCFEKGHPYAGLQRGVACYCGDSYGKYGASASSCTTTCLPPYDQSACGGHNANSVYTTGLAPLHKYCNPGWISSGDYCYTISTDRQTWLNAQTACRQIGADLATIDSLVENDLLFSSLASVSAYTESAWIGLNDLQESYFYQWSSGSEVVYTNWDINQPLTSPTMEQHCVAMSNQTGGWQTLFCERALMYICRMSKQPSPIPHLPPVEEGCELGYTAFRWSCYKLIPEPRSRTDASRVCETLSATLVRITDRFEQAYVSSLLGSQSGFYWTDSSDTRTPTVYQFSDLSSSRLYTNWGPRQPGSPRQCVALSTGFSAGLWYTFNCSSKQHAICEKQRQGFTPPPLPPLVPPSARCPPGWFEGQFSCYQVNSNLEAAHQLSWDEARADCQSLGADLASFHSHADFDNVWRNLMAGAGVNYWIGLHYSMQSSSLKWSDGTGVNFVQWEPGQSDRLLGLLNCVEVKVDTGNMVHQDCFALRNWVCSLERGRVPKPRTTVIYPTAGTPGSCYPFDDEWKYYGGSCYYVNPGVADDAKAWREARSWCQSRSVDLVSITSREEQLFVQSLIGNVSGFGLWIGLNQLDFGRGMRWSDGSPTVYENWDINEPNNFGYLEKCVDILTRNGKWNDAVCSAKMGFVCEQNINFTPPPTPPSVTPSGFCPSGYSQFGTKCLRVYGTGLREELKTWSQAWNFCSAFGPGYNLASIASAEENLFVTSLMGGNEIGAWFGLQRQRDGSFAWTDNSGATYTNWDDGEPSGGVSACVYIQGSQRYAGLWNDAPCGQRAKYICQTHIDSHIPTPEAIPNPCDSRMGFEPFKAGCYKYVSQPKNWTAAADFCHTLAADLPVVNNAFTQAFLQLFVARGAGVHADSDNAPTVWIGLSDTVNAGAYSWNSGWPVTFSNWAKEEPSRGPGEGCVTMGGDGLWSDDNCTKQLPFVCVILNASFTTYTPQPPKGQCVGANWIPFGDTCYMLRGDDRQSFYEGQLRCRDQEAQLASVHDLDTLQFLATMVLPQTPYSVWLGLYGSQSAGFSWLDGSPVQFTSWDTNQPSGVNADRVEEHCVAMDPQTTKWNDLDCSLHLGYICSKAQDVDTDRRSRPPVVGPERVPPIRSQVPQKTPIIPTKRSTRATVTPTPAAITIAPPPVQTQTPSSVTQRGPFTSTSQALLPTSQAQTSTGSGSGISPGAVAGIVTGLVLVLVFAAAITLFIRQRQGVGIFARPYHETTFSNILYNFTRSNQSNAPATVNEPDSVKMEEMPKTEQTEEKREEGTDTDA